MLTIDASTVNEIRDQLDSWRADLAEDGHFQVAEDVARLIDKLPDPDKDDCPLRAPEGGVTLSCKPYDRIVFGDATDPLGFMEVRSVEKGYVTKIRFWFPPKVRIFRGKVAERIIAEQVADTSQSAGEQLAEGTRAQIEAGGGGLE